jgi:preprotein translocase subunit YajC
MLESVAYAMGAPAGGAGAQGAPPAWLNMLPLVAVFAIFYLLLIRPQQKKAMLDKLKKGDRVMTSGGIYGTIHSLTAEKAVLIVSENVKLEVNRGFISDVVKPEDAGA